MPGSLRYGGVVDLSNFQEKNELTFDELRYPQGPWRAIAERMAT